MWQNLSSQVEEEFEPLQRPPDEWELSEFITRRKRWSKKRYYDLNHAKILMQQRAYCKANRERRKATLHAYYLKTKETLRAQRDAWRKNNPEKNRANQKAAREARARARPAEILKTMKEHRACPKKA